MYMSCLYELIHKQREIYIIHIYTYVYVYMYVYACIYTYIHDVARLPRLWYMRSCRTSVITGHAGLPSSPLHLDLLGFMPADLFFLFFSHAAASRTALPHKHCRQEGRTPLDHSGLEWLPDSLYMAVSASWWPFCVVGLTMRALLFGVHIQAPDV